jgi:hypothetical protein
MVYEIDPFIGAVPQLLVRQKCENPTPYYSLAFILPLRFIFDEFNDNLCTCETQPIENKRLITEIVGFFRFFV